MAPSAFYAFWGLLHRLNELSHRILGELRAGPWLAFLLPHWSSPSIVWGDIMWFTATSHLPLTLVLSILQPP